MGLGLSLGYITQKRNSSLVGGLWEIKEEMGLFFGERFRK